MSEVIRDLANEDDRAPKDFAQQDSDPNTSPRKGERYSDNEKSEPYRKAPWDVIGPVVKKRFWFIVFVILPTLLTATYYLLIASDQYVSESRFVIKAPNQRQASTTSLASLVQTTGMSFGLEQTREVLDYLNSRAAVEDISKKVDLKDIFQNKNADVLSRYPRPWKKDRFENLFGYYRNMVDASIDSETDIAVVKVRAFTPEESYRINESLLQLSEEMVNRLSERAQRQSMVEAERRVGEAEQRLSKARVAMSRYRQSENLVDPTKQATGVLEISDHLIVEQTALQAQLELMTRVAPQNPTIPSIRRKIEANERALARQYGRAVGSDGALAGKLPGYERVAVEQEMATQNYKIAGAALEQARLEAQNQHFYLERISSPRAPDLSQYPHRIQMILTIGFASLCLYFVGWMLVVGILEHAPED